ncbi:MAG TPA: helix-turn-helix transcriptional regulator [Gaiellaceae bacterium]|nr:helix-turn-helix transcriptional regulator [Gaiellaceae bacterium]
MDTRSEVREFLTTRRARITPGQAGLRTYGSGSRRVPGLRREEVALLAGVSVDYYSRLERGNASGVSETVLEALARALQLDETERAHLFDLARAAQTTTPRRRRRGQQRVRPAVQQMLDAMTTVPAFVRNGRLDILGANQLGRALYSQHFDSPAQPPNTARFVFVDDRSRDFYADWDRVAADVVAILRAEAGRDPYDRDLSDLVGELSTRSELFGTLWATHDVRTHDTGTKRIDHPLVGELNLSFEALQLVADDGLTMFVYTTEPGSKSEQALNLLASWTATADEETADADREEQPRR